MPISQHVPEVAGANCSLPCLSPAGRGRPKAGRGGEPAGDCLESLGYPAFAFGKIGGMPWASAAFSCTASARLKPSRSFSRVQ